MKELVVNNTSNQKLPWMDSIFMEGTKGWFVSGRKNRLMQIDFGTEMVHALKALPLSNGNEIRCNPYCIKVGNDIFCIPFYSNTIICYSMDDKKTKRIFISENEMDYACIIGYCLFNDSLYLLPRERHVVIRVNTHKKCIDKTIDVSCGKEKWCRSIVKNNSFYILTNENTIYCFNIETEKVNTINIPTENDKISVCSIDGNYFWLVGYRKSIYRWNIETNEMIEISQFPADFGVIDFCNGEVDTRIQKYSTAPFLYSVKTDYGIWFIPAQTNRILYIKSGELQINELKIETEEEEKSINIKNCELKTKYTFVRGDSRDIFIYSFLYKKIIRIDTEKENFTTIKFNCSFDELLKTKAILYEENGISLSNYLRTILSEGEK